jgi:hypothetical protein
MRPLVWFLLVVGVPQIGVALTLTHPALNQPRMALLVYLVGVGWACLAWRAARGRAASGGTWVRDWVTRYYVLPLAVCFAGAVFHDPTAAAGLSRLVSPNEGPPVSGPGALRPAASPARNGPAVADVVATTHAVRVRLVRFVGELFASVPPLWWGVAMIVAAWKGQKGQ